MHTSEYRIENFIRPSFGSHDSEFKSTIERELAHYKANWSYCSISLNAYMWIQLWEREKWNNTTERLK